jgi:hypothetical protein
MAVTVLPVGAQQFFDDLGRPVVAGFLYGYVAGTSTPLVFYQGPDLDSGAVYTNPIILDAAGRIPDPHTVYVSDAASVKLVLKDSFGTIVWTVDLVPPAAAA